MKYVVFIFAFLLSLSVRSQEYLNRYLILVVDVSGSIDDSEYTLQKQSYLNILRDRDVQLRLDNTFVAIIEFGPNPHLVVRFTDDYNYAAQQYERAPRSTTGTTRPEDALLFAVKMLRDKSGVKVIDISGDGPSDQMFSPALPADNFGARVQYYRQLLDSLGITCNGLIFGEGLTSTRAYYEQVLVNGFLMEAPTYDDFERSLKMKIVYEIS